MLCTTVVNTQAVEVQLPHLAPTQRLFFSPDSIRCNVSQLMHLCWLAVNPLLKVYFDSQLVSWWALVFSVFSLLSAATQSMLETLALVSMRTAVHSTLLRDVCANRNSQQTASFTVRMHLMSVLQVMRVISVECLEIPDGSNRNRLVHFVCCRYCNIKICLVKKMK